MDMEWMWRVTLSVGQAREENEGWEYQEGGQITGGEKGKAVET